jgi:hypothetical protein
MFLAAATKVVFSGLVTTAVPLRVTSRYRDLAKTADAAL